VLLVLVLVLVLVLLVLLRPPLFLSTTLPLLPLILIRLFAQPCTVIHKQLSHSRHISLVQSDK
jgi:hypothetical protein